MLLGVVLLLGSAFVTGSGVLAVTVFRLRPGRRPHSRWTAALSGEEPN